MTQHDQLPPDPEQDHADEQQDKKVLKWVGIGLLVAGLVVLAILIGMRYGTPADEVTPLATPTQVVPSTQTPTAVETRTAVPEVTPSTDSPTMEPSSEPQPGEPGEDQPAEPSTGTTSTPMPTRSPSRAPATPTSRPTVPATGTLTKAGIYEVGVDAKPGRYVTTVPDDDLDGCFWSVTKDLSGSDDSILRNKNVDAGARTEVTLKKGEYFQSEGCGTWRLQD